MTTLPTTLAMIAMSTTAATLFADQSADLNNDGNVDGIDLLAITSNLNQTCSDNCSEDLNNDGVINTGDIMAMMQQWGPVEGYLPPITTGTGETTSNNTPVVRDPNRDMSWQGKDPVLLDAIYYDNLARSQERRDLAEELNQGAQSKAWASSNGVAALPMSYNGAVDYYEDGIIDEADKEKFRTWVDANIPEDYSGPLCLDLEGQWWSMFETTNQAVMDNVIDFYIEGLEYAQSLRPNAKIGYWGIPKKSHSKENSTTASIERLLLAQTGLFPDVYEYNPGNSDTDRLKTHVEKCIQMVNGEIPVYVVAFPRYSENSTGPRQYHTQPEFMRDQVQSTLDAVWTDSSGMDHRVNGVALWDAYSFVGRYTEDWSEMTNEERKELWDDVDALHVDLLTDMKEYVDVACASAAKRFKVTQTKTSVDSAALLDEVVSVVTEKQANPQPQRTRLLGQFSSNKTTLTQSTEPYQNSFSGYRTNRESWASAKQAFEIAKRRYPRGSKQYKLALAEYKEALLELQKASRSFRTKRSAYRAARANLNNFKMNWLTASAE